MAKNFAGGRSLPVALLRGSGGANFSPCQSFYFRLPRSNWAKPVRADFPILDEQVHGRPLIYFDNAVATSRKAGSKFRPRRTAPLLRVRQRQCPSGAARAERSRADRRATRGGEELRSRRIWARARRRRSSSPAGTTEGINLVCANVGNEVPAARADVILLTEMEHHLESRPVAAPRRAASADPPPAPAAGGRAAVHSTGFPVRAAYAGAVKLFASTHISNSLGTINPVADPGRRALRGRAWSPLSQDGARAAGHLPVNARELGCVFLRVLRPQDFAGRSDLVPSTGARSYRRRCCRGMGEGR